MLRSLPIVAVLTFLPSTNAFAQGSSPARICLAPTVIEASTYSATEIIDAVRETFTTLLSGPLLQVQPLTSRLQAQVRAEASAAGCPYLLLTSIKHTRKAGGGGVLSRMAGAAVQQGASAAGAAAGSKIGSIAGSAIAGAASVATQNFAGSIKIKDELALEYRLEAGGTEILKDREKQKAESDGEDLLTPVAHKAAEAVATAMAKRSR
jgi:hypothetical protein